MLGRGLAGVEISSFAGDVELSDERLEPFWARAAELGAVVFLHPFGCSLDERLDRFYLVEHGRPARRERRRAVAPDLRGRARPASGSQDRRRARRRLPAVRDRTLRPRVAGAARGAALRARAVDATCARSGSTPSCTTRTRCAPRRGRRRLAGPARQRLPVRHGPRRSGPEIRSRGPARRDRRERILGGNADALLETRVRHEDRALASTADGAASARASSSTTASCRSPTGSRSPTCSRGGLDAAHDAFVSRGRSSERRETTGTPLADVRLLAPLVPAAIRDFVAFEEHVEGVSAAVDGKSEVVPEWYQAPTFYFTNPHTVLGPGEPVAPPVTERLDFELEIAVVIGGVAGLGRSEPDTGCRGIPHLRLHDHERLVGARPAVPRDEGAPRAGEGQGLRHDPRSVDRHGRRARAVPRRGRLPRGARRGAA